MYKIKNSFYLTSIISLLFSSYVLASDEEYEARDVGPPYRSPLSPSFSTPPEGGEGATVDNHLIDGKNKHRALSPSIGRSDVSEEVLSPSRGHKTVMVIRLNEKDKAAPGGSGSTGSNESPKGVVDLVVETFGIDVPSFVLPADGEGDQAVPQAPVTPAAKVKTLGLSKKRPLSDRPSGFKPPRRIQQNATVDEDRDVGQAPPKRMAVADYVPHESDQYVVAAIKTLSAVSGMAGGSISYRTVESGKAIRFSKDEVIIDLHLDNGGRSYNFTKVNTKYEGEWEQSNSFGTLDEAVNHILRYLRTAI